MPETTPLIKAALNLRGGAGFDVYVDSKTYSWMFGLIAHCKAPFIVGVAAGTVSTSEPHLIIRF